MVAKLAKGQRWTWCEIRPDIVVGFVPNNNAHCLQQSLGIYLSLYAHVNGKGGKLPFPGTNTSYVAKFNPASQYIIAQFSIHASLHPSTTGAGRGFNVADNNEPSSWSVIWPTICSFFGLEGTGPEEGAPQPGLFTAEHVSAWEDLVEEHQLRSGFFDNNISNPKILWFITTMLDYDHQVSLKSIRGVGFEREIDVKDAWFTSFERFRRANILPWCLQYWYSQFKSLTPSSDNR
jgi:hypothetical protein